MKQTSFTSNPFPARWRSFQPPEVSGGSGGCLEKTANNIGTLKISKLFRKPRSLGIWDAKYIYIKNNIDNIAYNVITKKFGTSNDINIVISHSLTRFNQGI